jgi:hypothetical protein
VAPVLEQLREHVCEVILGCMAMDLFYGLVSLLTRTPEPMYAGLIVSALLGITVGLSRALTGGPPAEPR